MRWLRHHSTKSIAVKVSTLETDLEFNLPIKSTGKDLFDLVCGTFGLRETWYFGLQSYILVSDGSVKYLNWLKPDKILSQHPLPLPFQFCYFFHAKFYPEDVEHELIQPITKHLFYLEVKDKIENRGRLCHLGDAAFIQPSLEAAIHLTVLSAQIEFEDFGDNEIDDETEQLALSKRLLRLLPKYLSVNVQVNSSIAQRLKECYMNNKGLTREDAEMRYLKIAQSYHLFGVDYFMVTSVRMKDPRTLSLTRYFTRAEFSHWRTLDRNQELSWVGITAAGIQLFTKDHVERARYTFPWNIIKNVSYRERKFTLKLNMVWRPHKKLLISSGAPLSSSSGGRGGSTAQTQHTSGHSPSSAITLREMREGSPSIPGTPVSGKRAPARPPLPPPPTAYLLSQSTKYLSATSPSSSHAPRGHLVRARSRERPLPSPGDIPDAPLLPRESSTTYGGGSTGLHPHRSTVSVSPVSDFTSGGVGGGIFSGSGMSSCGSVASGPLISSRQGATVIEIWLAEPYQAKNIIHLCAGNHSLFMRRRQPDSIDVQQMKAHEREERIRRETERARLLRERSEKTAALKLNAALESRCAELESALRSAAVAAGSLSPTSPVEPILSSRRPSSRRKSVHKTGESVEEEEQSAVVGENEEGEVEGENLDEDSELRRRIGVQFSSREPQECPTTHPAYARLQHQSRRGGEGKKTKSGLLVESPLIPVRSAEIAPHQGAHTGIYEGFILAQSTAESVLPTQSEPAIPQTLTWSPAREELTSLTYSRPPYLPPRPAMVSQSLEHLPSQQQAAPCQRPRVPGLMMPYPITSTLSLHSGYAAPLQQPGPQVVPSLASNYYIQQRLIQQGQQPTVYPWPSEGPSTTGHFTGPNGRLFNGFSYPGHLNLTGGGDEPNRQGGDLGGGQMKTSPSAATQPGHDVFFDYGGMKQPGGGIGGCGRGILQSESVPMMGQQPFRRPSFPHVQQPPLWTGVFSMNACTNPYANYPYAPSNSGTPLVYCPPYEYRGYNPMPYYDTNTASAPGFSQSVPCAPVSMPVLNAGDEFYMTGGGETEELPGPSGYYQPPWYPYYDPYWQWIRAATGSSTGIGPRSYEGWPPSTALPNSTHPHLPPPPPPAPAQIPMPPSTNAPLSALLSPYAGPTRRRIQHQKLAAARQLQRQQQQQQLLMHQHHHDQHGQGQEGPGRQVFRGISLQDLPSRTRSDSEGVGHTREYSASRPSLVQMPGATSSITFRPPDAHTHTGSGGEGGEDQQPPGIFTSPPPPNLISNQSAKSEEQLRMAYQQQIQMHRRIWEEWMWRASAAAAYPPPPPPPPPPLPPQRGESAVMAGGDGQQQQQHQQTHQSQQKQQQQQGGLATPSTFPSPGLSGGGVSASASVGGGAGSSTAASLRRMPPPPPPSYSQYMAFGTSPQAAGQQSQQHLTPDIRDPSGPDGSSSVGYVGADVHGVAPSSASPGTLTEGPQVPCSTEEPFQHHHEHMRSFSGLHRGHPGSVDRLNTMSRMGRTSVPGYITNSHLYANMTVVDGKLVPLMGRPAPALPEPSLRSVVIVPPGSDDTRPSGQCAPPAMTRQSRPLTRYHSSQTVWLTGAACEPSEAPRQQTAPSESVSPPQYAHTKVEIPKSVGFWEH